MFTLYFGYNYIVQQLEREEEIMETSIPAEIVIAIERLLEYIAANYSPKSLLHYTGILKGLRNFANNNEREPIAIITDYYVVVTGKQPFQSPGTPWLRMKARALLKLIDVINGDEMKREYSYGSKEYSGAFAALLTEYNEWLKERLYSISSIRRLNGTALKFLIFLEREEILCPEQISVDSVVAFLHQCREVSGNNMRSSGYGLRNLLISPVFNGKLSFDPIKLLSRFKMFQNE
jgi:hypothetical protein